jgi:hypothetical protein
LASRFSAHGQQIRQKRRVPNRSNPYAKMMSPVVAVLP